MLNEHSIYGIQTLNNVSEGISRHETISLEEYVAQCRMYVVDNMSGDNVSPDWDSTKRHNYLISVIENFVRSVDIPVDGFITKIGSVDTNRLLDRVVDEITGLGILKDAFENPDIDEIQINDYRSIFVVENGVTKPLVGKNGEILRFLDNEAVHTLYHRLITDGTGSSKVPQFTEGAPIVNAKTAKDQYRISAVHYSANARDVAPYQFPITSLVIRKFKKVKLTMDNLVGGKTLTAKMARFVSLLGRSDITLFCVGKTGSGKTTLLNIIGGTIPLTKRILLVQNPTEMTFFERDASGRNKRNAVHWEVRDTGNVDSNDITSATMENLLSNTLRFTPEVTIIGEARTHGEFEQIKRSIQMGQPVMGTFHAADSVDAIGRMATEAGGDLKETKKLFARATDIIISQYRYLDGSRRILEITEIIDVDDNGDVITNKLFEFVETGEITTNPVNALPHVQGYFRQVNPISENLARKFYRSSISREELEEFLNVDSDQVEEIV